MLGAMEMRFAVAVQVRLAIPISITPNVPIALPRRGIRLRQHDDRFGFRGHAGRLVRWRGRGLRCRRGLQFRIVIGIEFARRVFGPELLGALTADATGEGERLQGCIGLNGPEGNLLTHFAETRAEAERHLEEEFGSHLRIVLLFQGGLDTAQIAVELREFLLVRGEKFFLKPLELEMLEEMDFSLVFVIPGPESSLGNIEFFGDFGEAPAIGAERHEAGHSGGVMHRYSFRLGLSDRVEVASI